MQKAEEAQAGEEVVLCGLCILPVLSATWPMTSEPDFHWLWVSNGLAAHHPCNADTCATMELDANAKRLKGERDPELEAIAFECRQKDIA